MARRRYWQKVKPVRRQHPILIECFGVASGPVSVHIGNERYAFHPDGRGRLVAPVYLDDHATCFLARADMYRLAQ